MIISSRSTTRRHESTVVDGFNAQGTVYRQRGRCVSAAFSRKLPNTQIHSSGDPGM